MMTAVRRTRWMVPLLAICSLILAVVFIPVASAGPGPVTAAARGDFYAPPSPLPPGSNGDVIRFEPSPQILSIPGPNGPFPANATRIMYRSTDTHGDPIAVTGTYMSPALPWRGPGPRPLVSFAVGTHGQGDQCAPSKLLNRLIQYDPPIGLMSEYETVFLDGLLVQGIAIVLTDYEGLGTPGMHTYVNRAAEAHAVLDAARAAARLPGSGVTAETPIGLWGYSQGGGAVAAAAELQSTYAPELNVKGTYAGAPPADLAATLQRADGSILLGAIGYALNGISQSYPEIRPIIEAQTNAAGKAMLAAVANQCVGDTALRYGFHRTTEYTTDGRPLSEILKEIPIAQQLLAEQQIGRLTPSAPVLIQSGTNDDLVPHQQVRELARNWCASGTAVQFSTTELPPIIPGLAVGHALPALPGGLEAFGWMNQRFAGVPAPNNCNTV